MQHPDTSGARRATRLASLALAFSSLAALGACGGGGSSAPAPTATVSNASVLAGRFGSAAQIQVSGTNLDTGLAVTSDECTGLTRLTTAPYVSTSTLAYYSCTVARMSGTITFKQQGTGAVITSSTFAVTALPQVQFSFSGPVTQSVIVDLAADKAPITVANFLHYVNSGAGLYNGLIIHRVTTQTPLHPSIGIIQGGGYVGPGTVASNGQTSFGAHVAEFAPIPLETDPTLVNTPGTLAMARASAPNSATSEWYFNVQDNSGSTIGLDGNYAVFGSLHTPADIAVLQAIQNAACTVYNTGDGSCLPIPNEVTQTVVQIR